MFKKSWNVCIILIFSLFIFGCNKSEITSNKSNIIQKKNLEKKVTNEIKQNDFTDLPNLPFLGYPGDNPQSNYESMLKNSYDSLPKIKYSYISPSQVKIGDKVNIKFEIENIEDDKTISSIYLVGYGINNVLTNIKGDKNSDFSLLWNKKDLIPPKQKRTFNIEGLANKVGVYNVQLLILTIDKNVKYDLTYKNPCFIKFTIN